jgi:hypothetical protein
MYIKAERNSTELILDKISNKEELINEIKTLANTLVNDILYEKDIILHEITKDKAVVNLDIQNIIELNIISENAEQLLKDITIGNPIKIKSKDCPYYKLTIELDENSKLKITAASDLDPDFTWDTLIQWFPAQDSDKF